MGEELGGISWEVITKIHKQAQIKLKEDHWHFRYLSTMPFLSTAYLFSGGYFTPRLTKEEGKVEQTFFFGFHEERPLCHLSRFDFEPFLKLFLSLPPRANLD